MSMIKRGNCDNPNPTVISFSCTCSKCGYFEQSSGSRVSTCPQCQGRMTISSSSAEVPSGDCPNGVCGIDLDE